LYDIWISKLYQGAAMKERPCIKTVVFAGAGLMGASMGQIFAKYGYDVVLYDIMPEAIEK
jgi:pyruvate/2-oxoglutarate dehydrogenase complex dihydrolipoamide dehydrogenase (E3) component